MHGYSLATLAEWTGARLIPGPVEPEVEHLLIDSRKLVFPQRSLFFALSGQRRDGHEYIPELYDRGVRCFVVEREPDLELRRCSRLPQNIAGASPIRWLGSPAAMVKR